MIWLLNSSSRYQPSNEYPSPEETEDDPEGDVGAGPAVVAGFGCSVGFVVLAAASSLHTKGCISCLDSWGRDATLVDSRSPPV